MNNEFKDERIRKNSMDALVSAAIVGEFILVVKILFEIFTGSATLETTGWNFTLLVVMNIASFITLYRSKMIQMPKTLSGRRLTTEQSSKAKKERVIKSYIPESLFWAVSLTFVFYLSSGYQGLILTVITIISIFFLHLTIAYFWHEHNIKRYNEDLKD